MATVTINEFSDVGYHHGSTIPAYAGEQTDQTAITSSSSSQQSSAFSESTKGARVTSSGGDVRIKFGADPTATAASLLLKDGDYMDYISGGAAIKVAIIDAI